MRTYEFKCAGCGKMVTETVAGFEDCPRFCRSCQAKRTSPWAKKPGQPDLRPPQRRAAKPQIRLQPTCPKCKGRGMVSEELCAECNGTGVKES
ncbi:MAG: hypothetical protein HY922_10385 [Elusimicrobia bacterium]|nr:hypothetical protein [Elusimicrobiota bacterium]